jgi:aspartate aminotransferase-like enzyme
MQTIETPTILTLVDQLGALESQIERLREQQESIKAELKDMGAGTYAGALYSANVYYTKPRPVIDWKAIAEHFSPSYQLVTAHTSEKPGFLSCKTSVIKSKN